MRNSMQARGGRARPELATRSYSATPCHGPGQWPMATAGLAGLPQIMMHDA